MIAAIIVTFFLLGYYIERIRRNNGNQILSQIGHDLSKVLEWIFSVNGLFVILVGSVIAIVVFIITKNNNAGSEGELQLLSITLTITLSALIPTMISRIVTKNQLNEIIEGKLDTELSKYKASLNSIRKDKGHASRMSAVLLEQMASTHSEHEQRQQDNAAWAIGWASDAIIQYVLIRDVYSNALKNSASCINIIYKATNHINSEDKHGIIKPQDLKSIITMHSLIEQYGLIERLAREASEQREKDNFTKAEKNSIADMNNLASTLENIEKIFYNKYKDQSHNDIDFSNFCTITGMGPDFNEELNRCAKRIASRFQ